MGKEKGRSRAVGTLSYRTESPDSSVPCTGRANPSICASFLPWMATTSFQGRSRRDPPSSSSSLPPCARHGFFARSKFRPEHQRAGSSSSNHRYRRGGGSFNFRGSDFGGEFSLPHSHACPRLTKFSFSLSYISLKKFNFYEEYIKSRARVTSPSTELLKSTFVYKTPTCKSIHDTNLEHPWHPASSFRNFPKTEPVPVIGRLKRIGRTTESTESERERERVDASQGERGRAEIDGWTKLWRRGPPRVFRPCDGGQIYGRLATQTSVSLRILGLPPILLAIASSF